MSLAKVFVSSHPLVAHKLSILRDRTTKPKQVREILYELALLIAYDATVDLPLKHTKMLTSPTRTQYQGVEIKPKVGLVPILRSGLSMVEAFLEMIPTARVLHLGVYREKTTLQPVEYYNKLPHDVNIDSAIVLDPMIATSGTAVATVNILKDWGVKDIKFVCVCASREGLENLRTVHPDITVFACAVDDELDDNGYVIPGIGDAGDRLYQTPHDS
ncbi:uracil phosphoribosyltransferase [Paraphysoderma sedebokerense]|nr:uracil phosphoribosyltransferase [Paraphysoderma sedebokerense]